MGEWLCLGTLERPSVRGCAPVPPVPSCLVGASHGSYQHKEGFGSSAQSFDTAIVHKDALSVKYAPGLGTWSWEIRSGQFTCGFTGASKARFLLPPF